MNGIRSIDGYLDELRRELRGGTLRKRCILREVEDHLREASRREREAGTPNPEAEHRTIERFGSPAVVAQRFDEEGVGDGNGLAGVALALLLAPLYFVSAATLKYGLGISFLFDPK